MTSENNKLFMGLAIELAQTAFENNEVPVGAVVVQNRNSEILAAFSNQMRTTGSSLAHAEMLALQKSMEILKNERLVELKHQRFRCHIHKTVVNSYTK